MDRSREAFASTVQEKRARPGRRSSCEGSSDYCWPSKVRVALRCDDARMTEPGLDDLGRDAADVAVAGEGVAE